MVTPGVRTHLAWCDIPLPLFSPAKGTLVPFNSANWPYTLLGIMPTNNRLKAIAYDAAGSTSRTLIETWGRLHAVRTILGIAATLAYLWTLAHPLV